MKSSPALSQMSEDEDGGRKREGEKMKWVKKRRGAERNLQKQKKKNSSG